MRRIAIGMITAIALAGSALFVSNSQAAQVVGPSDSSADSANASESSSSMKAPKRKCEQSNDSGKAGAMGCFVDKGDEWYACDIHSGGSGTAFIDVTEWEEKGPSEQFGSHKSEEDNAQDGVKVLRDCDEGPEINIDEGHWLRLETCTADDGEIDIPTCDMTWIAE